MSLLSPIKTSPALYLKPQAPPPRSAVQWLAHATVALLTLAGLVCVPLLLLQACTKVSRCFTPTVRSGGVGESMCNCNFSLIVGEFFSKKP